MKKRYSILLFLVLLPLIGCEKKFSTFLEQARTDFATNNFINTVDNINVGLLHWKESDGNEPKAEAYQLMGQSYQQLRNTDKAIEAYQQAIQLSTKTFLSAYSLGEIFLNRSRPAEGLVAFQKALTIKPNDPLSLLGLANCLYGLRKYKDAHDAYQKVIDVSPGVKDALESLQALKIRSRQKQTTLRMKSSSNYKVPSKTKDSSIILKKGKKKK